MSINSLLLTSMKMKNGEDAGELVVVAGSRGNQRRKWTKREMRNEDLEIKKGDAKRGEIEEDRRRRKWGQGVGSGGDVELGGTEADQRRRVTIDGGRGRGGPSFNGAKAGDNDSRRREREGG
ncbi:hypothetical protein ACLOJK_034673 [Asimina triloba]